MRCGCCRVFACGEVRIAAATPQRTAASTGGRHGSAGDRPWRGVDRIAGLRAVPAEVAKGLAELDAQVFDPHRVRAAGGGRKKVTDTDPQLLADLERLVAPATRGDPRSPLRWTTKSTRTLARALGDMGHVVSHTRVGELLHELRYSLQANTKVIEGRQHPDRDAQFDYLNTKVRAYLRRHDPVISVDTKKKELVGEYANPGRQWDPQGEPQRVNMHDFADKILGKAVPYGVYDVGRNHGWVEVGVDHDTAAFAVAAIRAWWRGDGAVAYPKATRLLVTADAGGSNSYRAKLWKPSWRPWPPRPAWLSRSAIFHPARPSGTASSIGCSPRSAPTGEGSH